MFRQAATTKLFAYTILGMLYEEGKFLFTDPVSDYLPEWKDTKKYVIRKYYCRGCFWLITQM